MDHRRIGRELDLFDSDPLIGAGLPFWLPAGAAARHEIECYLRELERRAGYQHVNSPVLGKREMYERSGHLANFADDMFPPMALSGDAEPANEHLMMRPSMCPHHALIFKSRPRSYRDLPVRIAELGPMYRAERSGVLGGLQRVRSIWLNDAHNFVSLDGVGDEIADVLDLMRRAHAAIGVSVAGFRLSLRDDRGKYGGSGRYGGEAAMWDRAERVVRDALDAAGVPYVAAPGEAAFYGPKIDLQIVDPAGRESTLATVQVDFLMPERFDVHYIDASGAKARPVMVHRSLVGSMERLFAHLIEVHGGAFPPWYAPVQIVAVPVGPDEEPAARRFVAGCLAAGLRAEIAWDGSMGARIREAARRKVPYVAVIGAREAPHGEVALRLRDGRQLPAMAGADAIDMIGGIVSRRSHELVEEVVRS